MRRAKEGGCREMAGDPRGSPEPRRFDGSQPQSRDIRSVARLRKKLLRRRANILSIDRDRLLTVREAAGELKASESYVRRLLIGQRLFGIRLGPVWAIYREDLEAFERERRAPGRPPKAQQRSDEVLETRLRITSERAAADTDGLLRKARPTRKEPEAVPRTTRRPARHQ
jgi:excisionase family DNA binding protein